MKKFLLFIITCLFQNHTLQPSDISSDTSCMTSFPSQSSHSMSFTEAASQMNQTFKYQDKPQHNSSEKDTNKQTNKNSSKKGTMIFIISLIVTVALVSYLSKNTSSQQFII